VQIAKLIAGEREISSESLAQFEKVISGAKTVIWNGPLGVYEDGFEEGTLGVVNAIIKSKAYSVVGGGETTQFLASTKLLGNFSFVSAGGGAMLEFLAGRKLAALGALG